jgi:hypothetical protein
MSILTDAELVFLDNLVRRPDAVPQYGPGRVCAHHGCETRLSTYNPDAFCSAHTVKDETWRWLGHSFRYCPECGTVTSAKKRTAGEHVCASCRTKNHPPRKCTRCGEVKDADQFGPGSTRKDGRASHCRACDAARKRSLRKDKRPDAVQRAQAKVRERALVVFPNHITEMELT